MKDKRHISFEDLMFVKGQNKDLKNKEILLLLKKKILIFFMHIHNWPFCRYSNHIDVGGYGELLFYVMVKDTSRTPKEVLDTQFIRSFQNRHLAYNIFNISLIFMHKIQ